VITGDRRGSGTSANVSVVLYGEVGNSGPPKTLQNSSNNFERGIFSFFFLSFSSFFFLLFVKYMLLPLHFESVPFC
jgi:hypothetical protein